MKTPALDMEKSKVAAAGDEADIQDGYTQVLKLSDADIDMQGAAKDKALNLLAHHHITDAELASSEADRVRQKIDWRIMPLIMGVYMLQLLDKNSLSFAAIMGIKEDTNLTSSQYSWLGSLVYFGYLFGEFPAVYLMQRVPLTKYLGGMCMLWGLVVALHAVCHDFASLAVIRFLLGAIEVCTSPAAIYITGSWYTKKEQVSRVALWYMTSGWAIIFGGFFAWCLYQTPSFRWQGLFIFYGGATFIVGVLIFFFLSASPSEAGWLTEDEKAIALERVRDNKTGTEVWDFNSSQLKECFTDPRFYLIFLLLVSTGLPNGGLTAFGPTIIAGFGFDTARTELLSMAPGVGMLLGTVIALTIEKYSNRTVAGIFVLLLSCVGVIMMLAIPEANYLARYGGYVLMYQFPICVLFIIAFMTAGVAGSTKKFAFGAVYQIGYAVGNIIGPQTYRAANAPNYYPAKFTMLAFLFFTACLIGCMGSLHWWWNRKRDQRDALDAQNGVIHDIIENEEFMDKTDFRLHSFRYPL